MWSAISVLCKYKYYWDHNGKLQVTIKYLEICIVDTNTEPCNKLDTFFLTASCLLRTAACRNQKQWYEACESEPKQSQKTRNNELKELMGTAESPDNGLTINSNPISHYTQSFRSIAVIKNVDYSAFIPEPAARASCHPAAALGTVCPRSSAGKRKEEVQGLWHRFQAIHPHSMSHSDINEVCFHKYGSTAHIRHERFFFILKYLEVLKKKKKSWVETNSTF